MNAMMEKLSVRLRRTHVLAIALALLASASSASAPASAADTLESADLAALLRQLDMAERIARNAETRSPNSASRYHFDYARLHADLARIRAGIEDYLIPRRAQPRDLNELSGEYRRQSATP
jgi:RAQPRD family integrative conjugative element protein